MFWHAVCSLTGGNRQAVPARRRLGPSTMVLALFRSSFAALGEGHLECREAAWLRFVDKSAPQADGAGGLPPVAACGAVGPDGVGFVS